MKTISKLQNAIQVLETQRPLLGDEAVDTAISALVRQISELPVSEAPAGERKLVTVLFADLSGFTALSEMLDPEFVRNIINAIFERLAQVILKYGGFIEKYIGDEIMAMFGAPLSYEDHAERALHASLEMMEQMAAYNAEHRTDLDLHMGINTGMVVTGMIGSQGHQQYGVTGDTVNLAARLKQSSGRGQIFVGKETFRLTSRFFKFKTLPPLAVKGKEHPQKVYELLHRKEEQVTPWGERKASPLVGREKEMQALAKQVERLAAGRGGKLAVIGEAGIGKSRLMAEIKKRTGSNIRWMEGRSLSYSRESSFMPAQGILRKFLGGDVHDSPEKIRGLLLIELEKLNDIDIPSTFPFLAHLLQLHLTVAEEERIKILAPPVLNQRIHSAFRSFLETKAKLMPLVVLWEDLHWADPASLRLIESLLEIPEEVPILHLLVFRPIREEAIWKLHERMLTKYGRDYKVITLGALSPKWSATLAQNITEAEHFPPAIAQLIYTRTEGNPFFVEELVLSLLGRGILYLEGKEIKAAEGLQDIEIPTTLQGVIASRIDQLPAGDKIVLQTASILGRIFQKDILEQLLNRSAPFAQTETALAELIRHEFLRRRKSDDDTGEEYIFKHAFTFDVAYNSLLLSKREGLHEQAGETYLAIAKGRPEEFASILAFHYERTPDTAKAIHFLELAADRARRNHANDEAINLYTRAISQVEKIKPGDEEQETVTSHRISLLEKLGDIQELNGLHQEAAETYKKAMAALTANDAMTRARLLRKTGVSHNSARLLDLATKAFDQSETLLEGIKDPSDNHWWEEWFGLQLDRIFLKYWTGKIQEMKVLLERTFPEIEAHGSAKHKVRFYQNLVMAGLQEQKYQIGDQTMEYASTMMAITTEFEDVRVLSLSKFLFGFALLAHGDYQESIEAFQEGIQTADRLGDVINKIRCLNYIAMAYRKLGSVSKTNEYTQQTLQLANALNLIEYQASANAYLSWIAWKTNQPEAAIKYGKLGLKLWEDFTRKIQWTIPFYGLASWPLAAIYVQRKDWSACVEQLRILSHQDQQTLTPPFEPLLKKVFSNYEAGRTNALAADIEKLLNLAHQYKYL